LSIRSWKLWAVAVGIATALVTVLALVLVAPWSSSSRPIRHALFHYIEFGPRPPAVRFDLATGRSVPLETTYEIWADKRAGLYREIIRDGGRVGFDGVGNYCPIQHGGPLGQDRFRVCYPLFPFSDADRYRSAAERGSLRKLGTGVVDGHPVDWVAEIYKGSVNVHERAALDRRSHELRAVRELDHGRLVSQRNVELLDYVTRESVQFPVPKGGAPSYEIPPGLRSFARLPKRGFPAARHALGRAPLWPGRRFSRYSLDSVKAGTEEVKALHADITVDSAPAVELVYTSPHGTLTLDELQAESGARVWRHEGLDVPPTGYLDIYDQTATMQRDGLLIKITTQRRSTAVAAARRLRPL
jgi:hypothetical protein